MGGLFQSSIAGREIHVSYISGLFHPKEVGSRLCIFGCSAAVQDFTSDSVKLMQLRDHKAIAILAGHSPIPIAGTSGGSGSGGSDSGGASSAAAAAAAPYRSPPTPELKGSPPPKTPVFGSTQLTVSNGIVYWWAGLSGVLMTDQFCDIGRFAPGISIVIHPPRLVSTPVSIPVPGAGPVHPSAFSLPPPVLVPHSGTATLTPRIFSSTNFGTPSTGTGTATATGAGPRGPSPVHQPLPSAPTAPGSTAAPNLYWIELVGPKSAHDLFADPNQSYKQKLPFVERCLPSVMRWTSKGVSEFITSLDPEFVGYAKAFERESISGERLLSSDIGDNWFNTNIPNDNHRSVIKREIARLRTAMKPVRRAMEPPPVQWIELSGPPSAFESLLDPNRSALSFIQRCEPSVMRWGKSEVSAFIRSLGAEFVSYATGFERDGVDGSKLVHFSADSWLQQNISNELHRKRISHEIHSFRQLIAVIGSAGMSDRPSPSPSPSPPSVRMSPPARPIPLSVTKSPAGRPVMGRPVSADRRSAITSAAAAFVYPPFVQSPSSSSSDDDWVWVEHLVELENSQPQRPPGPEPSPRRAFTTDPDASPANVQNVRSMNTEFNVRDEEAVPAPALG